MQVATGTPVESLERLAQDVYEAMKQLALASPRGRRRPGDLKEGEFLTLAMLQDRLTLTVGEIQRELGVLPAQMSRIIRALENRPAALIHCRINPQDKRKVDVCLTDDGIRVLRDYRRHRIGRIVEILRELEEEDREQLAGVLERVHEVLRHRGET